VEDSSFSWVVSCGHYKIHQNTQIVRQSPSRKPAARVPNERKREREREKERETQSERERERQSERERKKRQRDIARKEKIFAL
jgi:hypothetical protein